MSLWKKCATLLCFSTIFLFCADGRAATETYYSSDQLIEKGRSAWRNKNYISAANYYDEAAKAAQTPFKRAKATFLKGLLFYSLGQFHQAIDQFKIAENQLKSDVSAPEGLTQEGLTPVEARLDLQQQIQFYIGESYFGLENWESAITHLNRSIHFERNPDILFKSRLLTNRARYYLDENIGGISRVRLFADGGILFDSNVILETATDTKVRHDDVGLGVEDKGGYALFLGIVPTYERPLFRQSSLHFSSPIRGHHYISHSLEDFDFFSLSPEVALVTPRILWNHPMKLRNAFTYSTSFQINTEPLVEDTENDELFDQIVNSYIGASSAQFFYSHRANTTISANVGYLDYKEGKGSTRGRDGIFLKGRLGQEFRVLGVDWSGGYSISALKRTGKRNQYLRQEIALGADFPFFLETRMALQALGYYTDFPRHSLDRKDHGGIVSARWTKMFGRLFGVSIEGLLERNRAKRVETTYDRAVAATSLFYLFQ